MTATEFAQYLSGDAPLADLSTATLADYLAKYPYSAPLQALLLKKYQAENEAAFEELLPMAAAMTPDRQQLYNILYPNTETDSSEITEVAEIIEVEKTIEVVETIEVAEVEKTIEFVAFVSQNPPQITAIELGIIK
jgi:hypothetical protein